MNSTKKSIQKTSGTHKVYKPGQLVTICKDVFRIVKNRSCFTDCYMCNIGLHQQSGWCSYCTNNLDNCYFELVRKHKG